MKRCILSLAAGLLLVLSACAPAGRQSSEDLIYPTSHPSSTSPTAGESQSSPRPPPPSPPRPAPVWGVQESACSQTTTRTPTCCWSRANSPCP